MIFLWWYESPSLSFIAVSHTCFGYVFTSLTSSDCISSHFSFATFTAFFTAFLVEMKMDLELGTGEEKYFCWVDV